MYIGTATPNIPNSIMPILGRKSFTDDVHSSYPCEANDSTIFHENDQAENNVIIEKFIQLQDYSEFGRNIVRFVFMLIKWPLS